MLLPNFSKELIQPKTFFVVKMMLIVNLQFHLVVESVSFVLDSQQLLKRFQPCSNQYMNGSCDEFATKIRYTRIITQFFCVELIWWSFLLFIHIYIFPLWQHQLIHKFSTCRWVSLTKWSAIHSCLIGDTYAWVCFPCHVVGDSNQSHDDMWNAWQNIIN